MVQSDLVSASDMFTGCHNTSACDLCVDRGNTVYR